MLDKLRPRSIYDVMAAIACFGALAGGTAYAANEWTGENIVDGSLTGADIFNNTVSGADITNGSLTGADVFDNTIGAADVTNNSLTGSDVANTSSLGTDDIHEEELVFHDTLVASDIGTGAVRSDEVLDNSLTGADINEGSLNMPPTTTTTFASQGNVSVPDNGTFAKVTSKSLAAGSYAIVATANVQIFMGGSGNPPHRDTACELRGTDGGFIGGGRDRRSYPTQETTTVSLSMNGGAQVPAGGGEVGLYCRYQEGGSFSRTADGQIMITKIDGFF
jgi:hypothetical protein